MAEQITFSIIIPTYNVEKTIENCLKSILNQKYKNYEVLIMDGLSQDQTLNIINSFVDEKIKISCAPDNGIYDAMNKGIAKAKGKWLYFLGGDDTLYDNNVLSKINTHAEKSSSLIIYGNVIMRGQNQWNLNNVVFNGEYNLEKMLITNMCHQSIFYHRMIFEKYGNYDLKYISSADQEFNLRCYANTKFDYIDIVIANFFVGGYSTFMEDIKFNQDRGAILLKYFKNRIFNTSFLKIRLYIQQAAFSKTSPLSIIDRCYCALAYFKLKCQAIILHKLKGAI